MQRGVIYRGKFFSHCCGTKYSRDYKTLKYSLGRYSLCPQAMCYILERALDEVGSWVKDSNLNNNPEKTRLMLFTTKGYDEARFHTTTHLCSVVTHWTMMR